MGKLEIAFEYCYGIPKLEFKGEFEPHKPIIIHASNGVMKTSFIKTLADLNQGNQPKDQIYINCNTKAMFKMDNVPLGINDFYLVEAYSKKFNFEQEISNLVMSDELKDRYLQVTKSVKEAEGRLLKKIELTSGLKSDKFENILLEVFKTDNLKLILEDTIKSMQIGKIKKLGFIKYKYDLLFDEKIIEYLTSDTARVHLKKYQNHLKRIYNKRILFKEGFFEYQNLRDLRSSLEANHFFDANNKIIFNGEIKAIENLVELDGLIKSLHGQISSNSDLLKNIEPITNQLNKNAKFRDFNLIIKEDSTLILEYKNLKKFMKGYLDSLFIDSYEEAIHYLEVYSDAGDEIEAIENEANQERELWVETIKLFSETFNHPVEIAINNKKESVLGRKQAVIAFKYKGIPTEQEFIINNVLSLGEQKALYLLNIMFTIQNIIRKKDKKVIVFDDVADSMDYQNKHALLRYFDLIKNNNFMIIILTNNFDFYRSTRRLSDLKYGFLAQKNQDSISLINGEYMNDVLKHFIKNLNQSNYLIASIPFARNLHDYKRDDSVRDNEMYQYYTDILHYRNNNKNRSTNRIVKLLSESFSKKIQLVTNKSIYKYILMNAKRIANEESLSIALEKKIVLSIAIRLSLEKLLFSKIQKFDSSFVVDEWNEDTHHLINHYHYVVKIVDESIEDLITRAQLYTPDSIHLNAFMYEPLMDISIYHLKVLFIDFLKVTPWYMSGLKDSL